MRTAAISLLVCLTACATTSEQPDQFAEPNVLMGQEIHRRVDEIRYQHRDVLFNNLLWLAQAGEQAIPSLLEGLKHEDPKVRSNCCWVLGEMKDRRIIPQLQALTTDKVESVRLEAARTLVVLGDMKPVAILIEGLDSERIQVRYLCHEALKQATNRDFDFDHLTDDRLTRSHAVYRWRRWWAEQAKDPFFAESYAQARGLRVEDDAMGTDPLGMPAAPGGETQPMPMVPSVQSSENQPIEKPGGEQPPTTPVGAPEKQVEVSAPPASGNAAAGATAGSGNR